MDIFGIEEILDDFFIFLFDIILVSSDILDQNLVVMFEPLGDFFQLEGYFDLLFRKNGRFSVMFRIQAESFDIVLINALKNIIT